MAYAIMRCKKLSSMGSVASSLQHCYRERETPNAVPEKTPQNQHGKAKSTDEAMGRLRELLPAKRRKDAVLAVEYLMTASPGWWEKATNAEQLQFFNQAHKWLASKYGAQNVFVATIHKDETSPHLSAFVVPLTKEGRLSAKEFIGNRTQMSADQTSFAEAVRHLGLERGVEGSKARHTSIADYYRRVGSQAPQTPAIDVPEPSVVDRLKPADYGQKVADSVLAQIGPEWNAIKAKAQELEAVKKRVPQLESAARQAQKQAKAERERAEQLADLAELFSPEEIAAARARKAERDKAEADRKQQAEKAAQKQQRIEALPSLARNTVGAERTFVAHALQAIQQAGGDASKVRWTSVEGAATQEAISKNGQSPEAVTKAICRLSPIRINEASHAAVAEWVTAIAPKYQQQYEVARGRSKGLGR